MSTTIIVIFVVLAIAIGLLQWFKAYVIQYLYFLRVPILVGIAIMSLPFLADQAGAKIIKNWFELEQFGLFVVTLLAILLAWTVMHTVFVLYVYIPCRNELAFLKSKNDELRMKGCRNSPNPLFALFTKNRYRLFSFGLIGVPIIYKSAANSRLDHDEEWFAIAIGIAVAIVLASITWCIRHNYLKGKVPQQAEIEAGEEEAESGEDKAAYFIQKINDVSRRHIGEAGTSAVEAGYTWRAALFFFLLIAAPLYIIGFFLLGPESTLQDHVPALAYVIVLLMLVTVILSLFTFFLDKYRIPLLSALVVVGTIGYTESGSDHFFPITKHGNAMPPTAKPAGELIQALDAWSKRHPVKEYPVMTVIAASGGGITAGVWTAQVLANLSAELEGSASFSESVIAVSSVSGGAVGMMSFVDAYDEDQSPNSDDLVDVVAQTSRTSLGAVGWGLTYPDVWRSFVAWMIPRQYDRGWAIERRWSATSNVGDDTLTSWRRDTLNGRRPIAFFNATIVESGERLVLSPLRINESIEEKTCFARAKGFQQLSRNCDIDVVTAARLSATFPYVTPISRPDIKGVEKAYHVADGGYYDNFGVLTALDYLGMVKSKIRDTERKMLLIQIRSSNPHTQEEPESDPGYFSIFTGPIKTLLNVRTPSQVGRNDKFIRSLKENWGGAGLETVTFTLDQSAPLSWHLSLSDKKSIAEAWCSASNLAMLETLKILFGLPGDGMSVYCDSSGGAKQSYLREYKLIE